jgi:hypothetical protein
MRAGTRSVLLLWTVAVLTSCQAPDPPGALAPPLAPITSSVDEVRTSRLPLPAGMRLESTQFSDAEHGYAFAISEPLATISVDANTKVVRVRSALFATSNGGRTWTERRLPRPVLGGPYLSVPPSGTVAISAMEGWYVSTDEGATFRHYPDPDTQPEDMRHRGGNALWVSRDCTPGPCYELIEHVNGTDRHISTAGQAVPAPEAATYGPDGRWWVFARDGDRISAAVSADRGATWQSRDVPAHPDLAGAPATLQAFRSSDGTDAWLAGSERGFGMGRAGRAARRAKPVDLPAFWLLRGDQWVAQVGAGRPPESTASMYTWVAAGGQAILVAGAHGLAVLNAGWTPIALPEPVDRIWMIADGTLVAGVGGSPMPTYLGRMSGRHLSWVQLAIQSGA